MKFKLIADTNVGLRDNNEDNFVVSPDLHDGKWTIPVDASIIHEAKDKGVLLVVADGMGGQNAGEVASEIAISTMQELFSPQCITDAILRSEASIKSYLKQCIVEADKRIKHRSRIDSETANMGSTIVIAWIIKHIAYIAWLGDSRAYSIIPDKGVIGRISKDHSYVQQLVDNGKITEKAAMTHPDSNIITRSLGDQHSTAKPDIVVHPLEKGEIILLCSDGLCGSVEDEVIGAIIKDSNGDLLKCKQDLMSIALKCGSSDNITIALFQVVDSALVQRQTSYLKRYLISIIGIILMIAAIVLIFVKHPNINDVRPDSADTTGEDTTLSTGSRQKDQNKGQNGVQYPKIQKIDKATTSASSGTKIDSLLKVIAIDSTTIVNVTVAGTSSVEITEISDSINNLH